MTFLDTNNLPPNFKLLGIVDSRRVPGEQFYVIFAHEVLYLVEKTPATAMVIRGKSIPTDEPGFNVAQFEMPTAALPWLIDTIENGFWKKHSEGGLPGDVLHVDQCVQGEDLRIRFSPNCGAEEIKGFTLKNYSRKGRVQNWQDIGIPYSTLRDGGMLDLWKEIALKHGQGIL